MQYRVTVPDGVEGGQIVSVNAEGAQFNVRVPPEVKAGETFLFSLTPGQLAAAQQQLLDDDSSTRNFDEDNNMIQSPVVIGTTKPVDHTLILFHDFADLGIALCLGCVIGIAIVAGFVMGVLFVTEPLPISLTES